MMAVCTPFTRRDPQVRRVASARLFAVIAALQVLWGGAAAAAPPAWPADAYLQHLVGGMLPQTGSGWDGGEFAARGTRAATYIAAGLLWRDEAGDRAAAAAALRGVVDLQYQDGPGSPRYGVWPTRRGETAHDANWREFIGCGLILILESFPERLPPELIRDIRGALLRAAEGAAQRDVGPGYTNIALMSAFLLDYVGTEERRRDLQQLGRDKAEAVHQLFCRHNTFDEFNSPTYYGVNLMALALWREHARDVAMRQWGRWMEAELWREIGAFYHAGMRNLCGPYVRAYGMDMTRYYALAGLWIALAVRDPALAPWPVFEGRHAGERIYGPIFALLQPRVPADVLPELREFTGPRRLERTFRRTQATMLIEERLMIGAARLDRQWDQHHPATIHWLPRATPPVGWILLSGENGGVEPVVRGRQLEIRRSERSAEPIQFLVGAAGLTPQAVQPQQWNLPGLRLEVQAAAGVTLDGAGWTEHPRYGRCLEIRYASAAKLAAGTAVLVLRP